MGARVGGSVGGGVLVRVTKVSKSSGARCAWCRRQTARMEPVYRMDDGAPRAWGPGRPGSWVCRECAESAIGVEQLRLPAVVWDEWASPGAAGWLTVAASAGAEFPFVDGRRIAARRSSGAEPPNEGRAAALSQPGGRSLVRSGAGNRRRWLGRVLWVLALVGVWVLAWGLEGALALPAGVPDAGNDEEGALLVCPVQEYPWDAPTDAICEHEYVDFCSVDTDGTADVCLIGRFQASPGLQIPFWYASAGGTFGSSQPWAVCVYMNGHYFVQWRTSGLWNPSTYDTSGFQGVVPNAGWSEGGSGYIFGEDDPTNGEFGDLFDAMWNLPTDANIQAYCGALDSGSEPPPEPTLIVFLPVGRIEEQDIVTMLLSNVAPGTEVSCNAQGPTVGEQPVPGETDAQGTFDWEIQWPESGTYGVQCTWEGVGEDEGPRVLVTVGSGVGDLSEWEVFPESGCSCGAWYNIFCHVGCALKWAFVPNGAVLYEMWDGLVEEGSTNVPLGPVVAGLDFVGEAVADLGRGMEDPRHYAAGTGCPTTAEVCEYGIMIGEEWSGSGEYGAETGLALWGVIPLAGGEEGGGLNLPSFRIMGEPEPGSALATWAIVIKGLLSGVLVAGVVVGVVRVVAWAMR